MQLFDQIKEEYERLSLHIRSLENAISALPPGSLGWQKRGENYRYYVLTDKKHYLSKTKDRVLIEDLAKKKYLQKMLSDDRNDLPLSSLSGFISSRSASIHLYASFQ